jgi:hypothetical protein
LKTSWIIGIMSLYMVCLVVCSIIEQTNLVTSASVASLQGMMQPEGSDVSNLLQNVPVLSGAVSLITMVWSYLKPVIEAIFLYFPDLWNGPWLWFYFIFILPISIGFVVSVVFILRGVPNF